MANNLLEQLTHDTVPPLPEDFERQVHQRLNKRLLIDHLADLLLRALPVVALQFGRAVFGLMVFTHSGRYRLDHHGDSDAPADRSQ